MLQTNIINIGIKDSKSAYKYTIVIKTISKDACWIYQKADQSEILHKYEVQVKKEEISCSLSDLEDTCNIVTDLFNAKKIQQGIFQLKNNKLKLMIENIVKKGNELSKNPNFNDKKREEISVILESNQEKIEKRAESVKECETDIENYNKQILSLSHENIKMQDLANCMKCGNETLTYFELKCEHITCYDCIKAYMSLGITKEICFACKCPIDKCYFFLEKNHLKLLFGEQSLSDILKSAKTRSKSKACVCCMKNVESLSNNLCCDDCKKQISQKKVQQNYLELLIYLPQDYKIPLIDSQIGEEKKKQLKCFKCNKSIFIYSIHKWPNDCSFCFCLEHQKDAANYCYNNQGMF